MCLGVGKWLEGELSMDQLGTQSAELSFNLLCELSRPLPCFPQCQGQESQSSVGMMRNLFEQQNVQIGFFNVVWSFTDLGAFFPEMRSCLHPTCCAGGQPRHLGTVITWKVIRRARIETCTTTCPVAMWPVRPFHLPSHAVLAREKGFGESLCLLKMAS